MHFLLCRFEQPWTIKAVFNQTALVQFILTIVTGKLKLPRQCMLRYMATNYWFTSQATLSEYNFC